MRRYALLAGLSLLSFATGCDAYSVAAWNSTSNALASVVNNAAWIARDALYYWRWYW